MTTMMRMTTKKKRKTTNSPSPLRSLHPFLPPRHPILVRSSAALALLLVMIAAAHVAAATQDEPQKKPSALAQRCLLYGNVFTADGKLLPDADVHVRRAADKKPKWVSSSDRRGEFAVRVPPGTDYVVEVKAKGYVTQTKTVTAQAFDRVDMVFHLDPAPEKKK